jgi:hypothetical protein
MYLDPELQEYYVLLDSFLRKYHEGHEGHKEHKEINLIHTKPFVNFVLFVVKNFLHRKQKRRIPWQ